LASARVEPQLRKTATELQAQGRLDRRVVGILFRSELLGAVDQVDQREGAVARCRFEHEGQKVGVRFGQRLRAQRVVAGRPGVFGLQPCAGHAADDRQREKRRRRRAGAVPPQEFRGAEAERVGPRADRFVLQPALQVGAECLDARVARRGLGLQTLGDDIVEIAAQRARQLCRRACAPHREGRVEALRDLARARQGSVFARAQRRAAAGEQLEQERAERMHIGAGRRCLAAPLLGRGVVGREGAAGRLGQRRGRRAARGGVVVEQLGDAEIEQLHLPGAVDQDVRRLQVAVQDQLAVRMRDRADHVLQQAHARAEVEPVAVAPLVDRRALDVLEHQIRLLPLGHAGVDQPSDVRMVEPREQLAFAPETRSPAARQQCQARKLDRDAPFVAPVAAPRQPHRTHAADAERAFQRVRAEREPCECFVARGEIRQRRAFEEAVARVHRLLLQQLRQLLRELGVAESPLGESRRACRRREIEQLVEPRAQRRPARGVERAHRLRRQASATWRRSTRRALLQSRCTVRSETPRIAAISANERPQKNFRSTSWASSASLCSSRPRASATRSSSTAFGSAAPAASVSSEVRWNAPPRFSARRSRT
jgi:hypothetical protein